MTPTAPQIPADHPAWTRAQDTGQVDADAARALAEQVCAVLPERDHLLMWCRGDVVALQDVWLPAVHALYAAWIEDLDPWRGAGGPAAERRREVFAALAACAAHAAWSCGDHARASVLAYRARIAAPAGPSADLAEQVARDAAARTSATAASHLLRLDACEAVIDHRARA